MKKWFKICARQAGAWPSLGIGIGTGYKIHQKTPCREKNPGGGIAETGGYIAGFLLTGLIYWLFTRLLGQKTAVRVLGLLTGLLTLYAFGTLWYLAVYARTQGSAGLFTVLSWCVFPFVVPDLIKLELALLLARRLAPALPRF